MSTNGLTALVVLDFITRGAYRGLHLRKLSSCAGEDDGGRWPGGLCVYTAQPTERFR